MIWIVEVTLQSNYTNGHNGFQKTFMKGLWHVDDACKLVIGVRTVLSTSYDGEMQAWRTPC